MKKPYLKFTIFLLIASPIMMANFGGSPGGRTGSPGDNGGTCATNGGCHGPKTPIAKEMISTNVGAAGYGPGDTLDITINATRNNINKYGFEIIAEDSNDDPKGTFVGNSRVTAISSGQRATHKAQSAQGSNNANSWDFKWVPPAAGTGDVNFYIAVLAANNNGGTGGDNVMIDTLTITENLSASVKAHDNLKLKTFPNPSTSLISITGLSDKNVNGAIYNMKGEKVLAFTQMTDISVVDLAEGSYLIRLSQGESTYSTTFIKN